MLANARIKQRLRPETIGYLLLGFASIAVDLVTTRSATSIMLLLFASAVTIALLCQPEKLRFYLWQLNLVCLKHKWLVGLLVFAAIAGMVSGVNEPAHAIFLQNAEKWMSSSFPQSSKMTPFLFIGLRGFFLIIVLVQVILLVWKISREEEWQGVVKILVFTLIAIALGDTLTEAIVGGGGGGANP